MALPVGEVWDLAQRVTYQCHIPSLECQHQEVCRPFFS